MPSPDRRSALGPLLLALSLAGAGVFRPRRARSAGTDTGRPRSRRDPVGHAGALGGDRPLSLAPRAAGGRRVNGARPCPRMGRTPGRRGRRRIRRGPADLRGGGPGPAPSAGRPCRRALSATGLGVVALVGAGGGTGRAAGWRTLYRWARRDGAPPAQSSIFRARPVQVALLFVLAAAFALVFGRALMAVHRQRPGRDPSGRSALVLCAAGIAVVTFTPHAALAAAPPLTPCHGGTGARYDRRRVRAVHAC